MIKSQLMTNEGGKIPNLSGKDTDKQRFLKAYKRNADPKSWGQQPPPSSQTVPQENTGYPIEEVLIKREMKKQATNKVTANIKKGVKLSQDELNEKYKTFRNANEEYVNFHHKSGFETKYWQARWGYYGAKIGLEIKVPECDRTMQEKRELEGKGRKLIYVPPELSTIEGLNLLNEMYPTLELDTENIINEKDVSGWIDVEASPNTPRKGTNEDELREQYKIEGLMGMNLNVYIISSLENKYREGKYFDAQTWSRLSSSKNGRRLDASFWGDGSLHVDMPSPETTDIFLGGRSMYKKPEIKPPTNP